MYTNKSIYVEHESRMKTQKEEYEEEEEIMESTYHGSSTESTWRPGGTMGKLMRNEQINKKI